MWSFTAGLRYWFCTSTLYLVAVEVIALDSFLLVSLGLSMSTPVRSYLSSYWWVCAPVAPFPALQLEVVVTLVSASAPPLKVVTVNAGLKLLQPVAGVAGTAGLPGVPPAVAVTV